jgi:uncharacterized membrane protein
MVRKTALGGVLFLLPVVVLIFVLGKALQISMLIVQPISNFLLVETLRGFVFVELFAAGLLLAVCHMAGVIATMPAMRRPVVALDRVMVDMIPPYAFAKSMLGSIARVEDGIKILKPVMVTFDDYSQMGFEIERQGQNAVIYLPGSPSPWSGSSIIVDSSRIAPLDAAPHEIVRMLRKLGRGSTALIDPHEAVRVEG